MTNSRSTTTNLDKDQDASFAAYFWLGEDGEMEGLTKEEFEQKQKDWDGPRPA